MTELKIRPSAAAVARHYQGLIDGFVIDRADSTSEAEVARLGIKMLVTHTVMRTPQDRTNLARDCLSLADVLASGSG